MVLANNPVVFWMDCSVYFLSSNLTQILRHTATTGISLLFPTLHSNFAVTHRFLYAYFPTEPQLALQIQQQATVMIFVRTHKIVRDILRWYVYCSLDERCIAPIRTLICTFTDPLHIYAHCHRFDQSTLNVILHNVFIACNVTFYVNNTGHLLRRGAASHQ